MTSQSIYRYARLVAKHGPLYPFWRNVLPRRILRARPIVTETDGDITVCALTSSEDWLPCLWALASFYRLSNRRDRLLLYSDGTLSHAQTVATLRLFPNARIVGRWFTDAVMSPMLERFPRCREYRRAQPCALRIIDLPAICGSNYILMLDSDVLFFAEPAELVKCMADRKPGEFVFQADFQDAYAAPRERLAAEFGINLLPGLNCGILLADVAEFHYGWLEEWLGRAGFQNHPWSEQTLWAMYAARNRTVRLSGDYALDCTRGIRPGMAAKHYVKPIRDLLYVEGIPRLAGLLGYA